MATNDLKLKIAIPFTADDQVNPIPFLCMVLVTAKLLDPQSHLRSNDPMYSPIENATSPKSRTNICEKYVMDLQTVVARKQFIFFIVLKTQTNFHDIKYNKKMFGWLKDNKHFISPHSYDDHELYYSRWLFLGMHPNLSSHNSMKLLLEDCLAGIKFNLITTSQFYITPKNKKMKTSVVELHAEAKDAAKTHEHMAAAFEHDKAFIEALKERSVGMMIDFIPMIKRSLMEVNTFRECLRRQTEFAEKPLLYLSKALEASKS
jgi:hypothetical protein